MGAGAVIVAMHHEQNIFKMGGLKAPLKLVYITMFVATLAISGLPPFAGFFSKDAILIGAFVSEHYIIWSVASFTAFLTAFYMFRLLFSVFHAAPKSQHKLQLLPQSMTLPLVVLAFGSATVGMFGLNEAYGGGSWFQHFLALPDQKLHIAHSTEYLLGAFNVALALSGLAFAYRLYAKSAEESVSDTLYKKVVINKFYIDELYTLLFQRPLLLLSRFIATVMDPKVFDGVIDFSVGFYLHLAGYFNQLQNGKVRYAALYILLGVSAMSYYLLFKLGMLI